MSRQLVSRAPFGAVTHSLRSPALRHKSMINIMKQVLHSSKVLSQHLQINIRSKPNVDTFFPVKVTRNCSSSAPDSGGGGPGSRRGGRPHVWIGYRIFTYRVAHEVTSISTDH